MINVARTFGSCIGLFLTGQFAMRNKFWVAFTAAGCLKLVYNALIVIFFWNYEKRDV
jgi:hypothetical protein